MRLIDLQGIAELHREHGNGFDGYKVESVPASLNWPDDVLEQWLYDHLDHFLTDYGHIDLDSISWNLEDHDHEELVCLSTGASERDLLEHNAKIHAHLVASRGEEVTAMWQNHGTWLRPPILLACNLVSPDGLGLQVVEGRTRLGVLRGRAENGLFVSATHSVWVGRRAELPAGDSPRLNTRMATTRAADPWRRP